MWRSQRYGGFECRFVDFGDFLGYIKFGCLLVLQVIYNRETDRSRGFGFVSMSSVEEAEKAVDMFHRYVSPRFCSS